MKMILFFLFMYMTTQIYAEDELQVKKSNYQMNSKYKAGMFLIYDCKGEYYACVDIDGNEKCREERDISINKKDSRYPCAPLKKYENIKACLIKNYDVIESLALKRFCFPKA